MIPNGPQPLKAGTFGVFFYFEGLLQLHTRTNEMREHLWIAAEPHKKRICSFGHDRRLQILSRDHLAPFYRLTMDASFDQKVQILCS